MAGGKSFVLCLTRVHSEQDGFGPRTESHHNSPISVQVLFKPTRSWDVIIGFWEAALCERRGHKNQALSTHRCDQGETHGGTAMDWNRQSLLTASEAHWGAHEMCTQDRFSSRLLVTFDVLLAYWKPHCQEFLSQMGRWCDVITSLQFVLVLHLQHCLTCSLGLWKTGSCFLYFCFLCLFLPNHLCTQRSRVSWPYHLDTSTGGNRLESFIIL